jgi:hypothetical protein
LDRERLGRDTRKFYNIKPKQLAMKSVHELSIDELEELRDSYYYQLLDTDEEVLGDIVFPDEIPMENVIAHYEGTYFVEEDFFCNVMSILK